MIPSWQLKLLRVQILEDLSEVCDKASASMTGDRQLSAVHVQALRKANALKAEIIADIGDGR